MYSCLIICICVRLHESIALPVCACVCVPRAGSFCFRRLVVFLRLLRQLSRLQYVRDEQVLPLQVELVHVLLATVATDRLRTATLANSAGRAGGRGQREKKEAQQRSNESAGMNVSRFVCSLSSTRSDRIACSGGSPNAQSMHAATVPARWKPPFDTRTSLSDRHDTTRQHSHVRSALSVAR